MATTPKQELHELVDRLNDEEARRLSAVLRNASPPDAARYPRPLDEADIILTEPLLSDDETADEMIASVRRWQREGGYARALPNQHQRSLAHSQARHPRCTDTFHS